MKDKSGLSKGSLRGLVKPYCSIDRIQPKLNDSNIVIVFYVERANQDAAYDLSNFIEKGPWHDVIDTEVSDVPNADGEYEVFVEVPRNLKFSEEFLKLISDINLLTDIESKEWKFSTLGKDTDFPLTKKTIEMVSTASKVQETFSIGYDNYIIENYNLKETDQINETVETMRVQALLGSEYQVGSMESGKLIIEKNGNFFTLDKIL